SMPVHSCVQATVSADQSLISSLILRWMTRLPWNQGIAPECVHSINALVAKVARLLRVACQRS
ncbi:MAG TPA: hypothetical protein VF328_12975, partial [Mycobacterium sp.]